MKLFAIILTLIISVISSQAYVCVVAHSSSHSFSSSHESSESFHESAPAPRFTPEQEHEIKTAISRKTAKLQPTQTVYEDTIFPRWAYTHVTVLTTNIDISGTNVLLTPIQNINAAGYTNDGYLLLTISILAIIVVFIILSLIVCPESYSEYER